MCFRTIHIIDDSLPALHLDISSNLYRPAASHLSSTTARQRTTRCPLLCNSPPNINSRPAQALQAPCRLPPLHLVCRRPTFASLPPPRESLSPRPFLFKIIHSSRPASTTANVETGHRLGHSWAFPSSWRRTNAFTFITPWVVEQLRAPLSIYSRRQGWVPDRRSRSGTQTSPVVPRNHGA